MKALLDMPVSASLIAVLDEYGHEGIHAGHVGKSTATDGELLQIARDEGRVVVTADLDFPRLLALSMAKGPGVILFRGGNYSDAEMRDLSKRVLHEVAVETLEHSICVVDKHRIRITRLPLA